MGELTELEMSNAFDLALKAALVKGIPTFDLLYKEVVCQQGIADFIGLTSDNFIKMHEFIEFTSVESSSLVLSVLKHKAGRSRKYIKKQTNLKDTTLNRVIRELVASKYVINKKNLYYLAMPDVTVGNSTWAFELKLSNWKRAIFQALQYKAFANYSVVVFPFEKEKILRDNLESFRELNIGVLLFCARTYKAKWLCRPKKEKPISKWQTFFLLEKISRQYSKENNIIHE